jgi:histidyl-tRNA synthetase
MRPEGTAGAVRAFVQNSMAQKAPVTRWYYSGPMFRHERQQKGRYRQFYQMGVEALGPAQPSMDAEQIGMVVWLLGELGVVGLETAVNSVGSPDDRAAYLGALATYLQPHRAELCADCQRRLELNPLRVLDCKEKGCQQIIAGAPAMVDHLTGPSKEHFEGVKTALGAYGVSYTIDPRLVRGLDYYTGTVFEVRATGGDLGAQNTLVGGGRYDRLVRELGGPQVPAVGRLVMSLPDAPETYESGAEVFFAFLGDAARLFCLREVHELRKRGFRADMDHAGGKLGRQFERADKAGAKLVIIVGDQELAAGQVQLRDKGSGTQRMIEAGELVAELKRILR